MALTTVEKERVRYHLGYLNVAPAASISFGLPKPIQTLFIVDLAMENLLVEAEPRLRETLGRLDTIECRLFESTERLAAIKLGDLELRVDESDKLEREYVRWAMRLADMLGVPIYPYSERFKRFMGGGNIPVSG